MLHFKISLLLFFCINFAKAQLEDNFSDKEIRNNPQWMGDTNQFMVNDSLFLKLNAPAKDSSFYISTHSMSINNACWQCWVKLDFNPSSSNFTKIYLTSDNADLKNKLNGYFVKIGDTDDEICLYRQDGTSTKKIIDGKNKRLNLTVNRILIKVTRDKIGNWQLFTDTTANNNYFLEGSIFDDNYITSRYAGIVCTFSKTRNSHFYFDNFYFTGKPFIDSIAPVLDSFLLLDTKSIRLFFSEKLDSLFALTKNNYLLNKNLLPSELIINNENKTVIDLFFFTDFINGTNIFNIIQLRDTSQNYLTNKEISFLCYKAKEFDVVINEIMADPSPTIGLPEFEYIELYNKTNYPISLKDWKISVGNNHKIFPNITINEKEYLIICHPDIENEFKKYGKTLSLFSSKTSLSNDGQLITIKDKNGYPIHFVNYLPDWYGSNYKAEGGWSLEQIDYSNPCGEQNNWIASTDKKGGTPGAINSVYVSNSPNSNLKPLRVSVLSDSSILLHFNVSIDSISSFAKQNYYVDNGIGYPIKIMSFDKEFKSIYLIFSSHFKENKIYNLTTKKLIQDCVGNFMNSESSIKFAIPVDIDSNDIIINEVLFNPLSEGVDFIEIYNRSQKVLDLKELKLANRKEETFQIDKVCSISENGFLIFPGDYYVITTNPIIVKEQYQTLNPDNFIELKEFPTFNDDKGKVVLVNKWLSIIDEFAYNESMHFSLINNSEGVSLERIHYDKASNNPSNWISAAETVGFATPSYKNSQFTENTTADKNIQIEPEVFSPDNDGYHDILFIKYLLSESGNTANIKIYNTSGKLIKIIANNTLISNEGYFSWDGTDVSNQKAQLGIYIIYIELFNEKGEVKHYKKTGVLGGFITN